MWRRLLHQRIVLNSNPPSSFYRTALTAFVATSAASYYATRTMNVAVATESTALSELQKSSSAATPSSIPPSSSSPSPSPSSPSYPFSLTGTSDDDECPWCKEMRAGPCLAEFIPWRNCSLYYRRLDVDIDAAAIASFERRTPNADGKVPAQPPRPRSVSECMIFFNALRECVKTPGAKQQYYARLLPTDDNYRPSKEEIAKDLETDEL